MSANWRAAEDDTAKDGVGAKDGAVAKGAVAKDAATKDAAAEDDARVKGSVAKDAAGKDAAGARDAGPAGAERAGAEQAGAEADAAREKQAVATNLTWHDHKVSKAVRSGQKQQKPCVVWLTGLSGAGKSTLASAVEAKLVELGHHTYLLDGDNIRHGLNRDLGFSDADRVENIRRIGEAARLFVDAGLIVITAFISPFKSDRQMARSLVEQAEFVEVFVDAPLAVCELRDPKGLYVKARRGEIKQFTGIDSPYEAPEAPEVRVPTGELGVDDSVNVVLAALRRRNVI